MAEYMATLVFEFIWFLGLLKELNIIVILPIKVFSDSKAAIQTVGNPMFHKRTNNIKLHYHFTRERAKSGFIDTQ